MNDKTNDRLVSLQDVVVMGATLEKLFYDKLADMPADVREKGLFGKRG